MIGLLQILIRFHLLPVILTEGDFPLTSVKETVLQDTSLY